MKQNPCPKHEHDFHLNYTEAMWDKDKKNCKLYGIVTCRRCGQVKRAPVKDTVQKLNI